MARMKSLFCATAILLLMVTVNVERAEAQCGGFQGTCNSFSIGSNGVFSAQCQDDSGTFVGASIDLNNFISNSNGTLISGGDFAASCQGLGFIIEIAPAAHVYIVGSCLQDLGNVVYATFDINYNVVNRNGVLSFQTC